jgi:hypothetical protein
MSSEKHPNLQLHKWAPTDYVRREEWNDNFGIIDDEIGILNKKAGGIKDVTEFGADNTGVQDSVTSFETAIASLQPGETLKAQGTFYLTRELQLKKDNVNYDFRGATFIGPTGGTPEGGLVTVGDRTDMMHVVKNVRVYGGTYVPKNTLDNGLNIGQNADSIEIRGVIVDCTTGQRGIAIQNNESTYTITNVLIDGVYVKGGKNAINVDGLNNSLIENITITNVIGQDTEEVVRISSGGSGFNTLKNITISNITGKNVRYILNLNGIEGTIANVQGESVRYRAFSFNYCKNVVAAILKAQAATTMDASSMGLVLNNTCINMDISDVQINGTWDYGIYASCQKSNIQGKLTGTYNSYVLNTIAGLFGNRYDLFLETSSALCNAYRDGDLYLFKQYDASGVYTFNPKGDGRVRYGTAAPTTGTWSQGDYVKNIAPIEGGTAGSKYVIRGWICVSSGTPGTWVQDRALTGN